LGRGGEVFVLDGEDEKMRAREDEKLRRGEGEKRRR
jgi:hypothetical protein